MATLKQLVPWRLRQYLRAVWADLRRDELTPPDRLIRVVGGSILDFRPIGESWVAAFVREAGLRADERVLDLGCGVGRSAVALTRFMGARGSYEGLDIVRPGIEWCRAHITPRFPSFRFTHADVYNRHYNASGATQVSEYRLPYPDGEFDFVFLTSIYTHLVPRDARAYLAEIHRVLRPGGRCFNTFALLTEASRRSIAAGTALGGLSALRHEVEEGCVVADPADPEFLIAYPEERVAAMYAACGFLPPVVIHGSWCGTEGAHRAQDIVIATKPAAAGAAPAAAAAAMASGS
ncbi:MAG TPA: class I SAM-dependent methyltransferase [Planctomycetota bacterium]|nr:class I SAM-dependent methyltransferase [Planctomycetota bacterium]